MITMDDILSWTYMEQEIEVFCTHFASLIPEKELRENIITEEYRGYPVDHSAPAHTEHPSMIYSMMVREQCIILEKCS